VQSIFWIARLWTRTTSALTDRIGVHAAHKHVTETFLSLGRLLGVARGDGRVRTTIDTIAVSVVATGAQYIFGDAPYVPPGVP
jgi:hypothetical protein